MRIFGEFLPNHIKVWNFHFDGIRFQLKKYTGVIFHDAEQWCKIWINPDLVVSKMARGIGWTFIRVLKSLKNCTLMGSFCPKHIMFQVENFRGIMCHDTEEWCIILKKMIRALKNDIRDFVNLHFDGLLLSKAYKDLTEKVQKSYVSWHWRVMQSLKKNWPLAPKNNMRNLVDFNASSGKSENLHFDMLLLSIADKVSAKKVQKNYLS